MTRDQFIAKAIKFYGRELGIPAGWWGTRADITNGTVRIQWSGGRGGYWRVSCAGMTISRHDTKAGAINKARKL